MLIVLSILKDIALKVKRQSLELCPFASTYDS